MAAQGNPLHYTTHFNRATSRTRSGWFGVATRVCGNAAPVEYEITVKADGLRPTMEVLTVWLS